MISRLNLYIDSIKRFSARQIWAVVSNRLLKKHLTIFTKKKVLLTEKELIAFTEFNNKLKKQFNFPWENIFSEDSFPYPKHYTDLVESLIDKFDVLPKEECFYSSMDTLSQEVKNNFQRFYLFYEIQNYKRRHIELHLITFWIKNSFDEKTSWESFNCAIRLFNWLKLLSNVENIERDEWTLIQQSFHIQIQHVISNIHHDVPGNHVALQYFSIWLVLKLFTTWDIAKEKADAIEASLITELINEFDESGFHFEKSFHYHVQITLMVLLFIRTKEILGETVSPIIKDISGKAQNLIPKFCLNKSYPAMFGDNCYNFFTSNLLSDISLIERINGGSSKIEAESYVCDIKQQYVIVKENDTKLIYDVGNIGMWQNPGHGHSDLQSFVWGDKGNAIFIDPGTREYGNSEQSKELKRTRNHNTISVGGKDQAVLWGFFRWAFLPQNEFYKIEKTDSYIKLSSAFMGFKDIGSYRHYREVLVSEDMLKIHDMVEGNLGNDIYSNFILAPEVNPLVKNNNVELFVKSEKYNFYCETEAEYTTSLQNISIYKNYNTPLESNKIELKFEKPSIPFSSTITIEFVQ